MPKKSIEINPFDGGLNNHADARDIKENELALATNVKTDQPGRLRIADRPVEKSNQASYLSSIPVGRGLFRYDSDYAENNDEADTEYELILDGTSLKRRTTSGNFSSFDTITSGYSPAFFNVDGAVRLSSIGTGHDTRYYGVSKTRFFGLGSDLKRMEKVDAYIDPPTDGDLVKDPSDSTDVPPNQNAGSLDLIVQQKTGSKEDWFNFDQDNSNLNYLYNQYYSDSAGVPIPQQFTQSTYNSNTTHVLSSDGSIDAESGKMYKAVKGSDNEDYNRIKLSFTTAKSYEDKSIFISVYVPSAVKNNMKTTAFMVRVGNNIASSGTTGNDCYIYNFGSDQITADEWTVLELQYGMHDEIEGSPNASGIKAIQVIPEYLSDSTSNTTIYLDSLKVGDSSRGIWNGKFRFFYSWIYDGSQESETFKFNGQSSAYELEDKILQFRAHAKLDLSSTLGGTRRITGTNIYYVEYDIDDNPLDTDKKFLMVVDLEDGVKKAGADDYEGWGYQSGNAGFEAPYNSGHTNYLQIMNPPVLETFSTNAGYTEVDKITKMRFKTAVVMNRRSYVGNVKVTMPNGKEMIYSDRLYKSEPNMPDVYTENGYVDIAINDGESITALSFYGDILMQFKQRTLYLLNATQEIEYLEDTLPYKGVWGQAAVCQTDRGVAWVNDYGLYHFDGKQVLELIDQKIESSKWNDDMGTQPIIGYKPLTKELLILGNASGGCKGYIFSMVTESFTKMSEFTSSGDPVVWTEGNLISGSVTNMTTHNNGDLVFYQADEILYKWAAPANSVDTYIEVLTRDQDFKDPARRKAVKRAYLTFKSEDSTNFPSVKYRVNGRSDEYSFSESIAENTSGEWKLATLTPSNKSEANDVYSFQVSIKGETDPRFEINDINVVYRDKVLK